jgi:hypothetical protein
MSIFNYFKKIIWKYIVNDTKHLCDKVRVLKIGSRLKQPQQGLSLPHKINIFIEGKNDSPKS